MTTPIAALTKSQLAARLTSAVHSLDNDQLRLVARRGACLWIDTGDSDFMRWMVGLPSEQELWLAGGKPVGIGEAGRWVLLKAQPTEIGTTAAVTRDRLLREVANTWLNQLGDEIGRGTLH
jgi:hypothetical protein